MIKYKKKLNNLKNPIITFCLAYSILIFIFAILDLTPFGDKTLLISDMTNQYINFYSLLDDIFLNKGSYLLAPGLGGSTVGLISYYLLSPFNILFLIFPKICYPLLLSFIYMVKISLAAFFMVLYLDSTFKRRELNILFGLMYAFMSYNIVFCFNFMWLDGVMLLPLLCYTLDYLILKSRIIPYIFILSLIIIINYYIGFIICIFTVIYFIYSLYIKHNMNLNKNIICNFIFGSLLAAGISSVVLVPTMFFLSESVSFGNDLFNFERLLEVFPIFDMFFPNSFSQYQLFSGYPNIYVGLIVIPYLGLFIFSKTNLKEKLSFILIMSAYFISFYVSFFNKVWHGFAEPHSFLFRYSFTLSFFLLIFAYRGVELLNRDDKKQIFSTIIFSNLIALLAMVGNYTHTKNDLIPMLIICLIMFSLFLFSKNRLIKYTFVALIIFDLMYNCYFILNQELNQLNLANISYSFYNEQLEKHHELEKHIDDKGLYRMEQSVLGIGTNSDLYDYFDLSQFSSTEKNSNYEILSQLGFHANRHELNYIHKGINRFPEIFLGLKYKFWDSGGYENEAFPLLFTYSNSDFPKLENNYAVLNQIEILNYFNMDGIELIQTHVEYENLREENGMLFVDDKEKKAFIHIIFDVEDELPIYISLNSENLSQRLKCLKGENVILDTGINNLQSIFSLSLTTMGLNIISIEVNDGYLFPQFLLFTEDLNAINQNTIKDQDIIHYFGNSYYELLLEDGSSTYILTTIPYDEGWSAYGGQGNKLEVSQFLDAFIKIHVEGEQQVFLRFTPKGGKVGLLLSLFSIGISFIICIFELKKS